MSTRGHADDQVDWDGRPSGIRIARRARRIIRSDRSQYRLDRVGVLDAHALTIDGVADLVDRARNRRIDEIMVVPRGADEQALARAVEQLAACRVDITLDLGPLTPVVGDLAWGIDADAAPRVVVVRQPMRGNHAWLKRALDLGLGAVLLVALLPLFCLVALAIRLDSPGPVFFRQTRRGLDQRCFEVWKFRTMGKASSAEFRQACQNDARVTRVGRILRRTSVDELPQLFNVLRGEMSLVGPRPHPVPLDDRFMPQLRLYAARHRVLPGITGLAQINGCRGETETIEKMAARLRYDLEYIRSWSLWLDLKIIGATLCGRFLHPNAY